MIRTSLVIFLFQISLIRSGPVDKHVSAPSANSLIKDESKFMQKHNAVVSAVFDDLKKLKNKKSADEIRRIATVGILAGALKTERNLNERLAALARDFFGNFSSSTAEDNMEKLFNLEQTMERDKRAMDILGNALDFAIKSKTIDEYKADMEEIARINENAVLELENKKLSTQLTKNATGKGEKVGKMLKQSKELNAAFAKRKQDVRASINKHIYGIHAALKDRENQVIRYLKTTKSTPKTTPKPALGFGLLKNFIQPKTETTQYDSVTDATTTTDAEGYQTFPPSQKESRLAGLFNRLKRQDITSKQDDENEVDGEMDGEKANSESGSSSSSEEEEGGLIGLIANLSGADEGSDVGALIGALTGVVTNLFGPGGLDVPSLLATGVGLLAGLLSGDDNFGKVLGSYGVAVIDAASGGGGANLNGEFFGQLLGTVLAGLSANPEDEDLPLTPGIFIEKFFSGSRQAVQKVDKTDDKEAGTKYGNGGSDIFGFIVHVVSSIVGGVTSLILNTSLGSSGGSSQGSADLSGGSSGASSSAQQYPVADEHHH